MPYLGTDKSEVAFVLNCEQERHTMKMYGE
jgi:hypothetical protein